MFAVLTHEDVPDVLYGQLVKDRRLFAKEEVRYEADVIAGRRGDDAGNRAGGGRPD